MQSGRPTGNTTDRMGGNSIQVGDRVVGTQLPDVLTVIARTGDLVEIESGHGVRMRVLVKSLRKLDAETPPPKDEA